MSKGILLPQKRTMKGFENLSPAQLDELLEAHALVTVLVGLADGQLDREERTWSARLVEVHTYVEPLDIRRFFDKVLAGFSAKTAALVADLPADAAARNEIIGQKLARLNDVFPLLDAEVAYRIYRSLVGLAAETAKASGGFLRIGAVNAVESEWVRLPMLRPIPRPANMKEEAAEKEEKEG